MDNPLTIRYEVSAQSDRDFEISVNAVQSN